MRAKSVADLVELLIEALRRPQERQELIRAFQREVLEGPGVVATPAASEALTRLATDLDFYVADPERRSDHRSYYGENQLRQEILAALGELVETGELPSSVMRRATI